MSKCNVIARSEATKQSLLIIFSATLLSLAFSSFNLDFLIWFGFVPLFFALENKNGLKAFFISYFYGFLFFASSMYWLFYVTPTGWFILSFYQALYFGIFGLVFFYFTTTPYSPHSTPYYFSLPSAWVILEYIRSHLAGGIGWNLLGYSQYKNLPIIQIASFTGVYGVSFLIMLMNIAIYKTIKMAIKCYATDAKFRIKTSNSLLSEIKSHPAISTFIASVLFAATLVYGYAVIANTEGDEATEGSPRRGQSQLKVSVVQGNIPQIFKWDENYKKQIMDKYEGLSKEAIKDNPDLIIWPETALPGFLNYDDELLQRLKAIIKETKTYFLVGAPMTKEEAQERSYNSALLFSDKGKFIDQYNKLHLVAFGEFIPFEENLPFLRKLLPITGDFISGKEYTKFVIARTPSVARGTKQSHFSVLICFEDIFPNLVRQFVKNGADFMVNITNDAWFNESCAAYQHAANSVFRAVENRRPFVRSANTGLSCFIDKNGAIYDKVTEIGKDLFIDGAKTAQVAIDTDKKLTFYTKFGDIFIIICIIIVVSYFIGKMSLTHSATSLDQIT